MGSCIKVKPLNERFWIRYRPLKKAVQVWFSNLFNKFQSHLDLMFLNDQFSEFAKI